MNRRTSSKVAGHANPDSDTGEMAETVMAHGGTCVWRCKRRATRRKWGIFFAVVLIGAVIGCSEEQRLVTVHSFSDYEATVAISVITETTRVLHISDSHISVFDESEKEYHPFSARMDNAYKSVRHYRTREKTTPVETFLELMDVARDRNVDVIVLTGDIVNNPSQSSVSFVSESIQRTGIPSMYVAGNHDWHYEGMDGSGAALRRTWIQKSLLPLYGGTSPLFSSRIIRGINFVTIDNSTYQVNTEQLAFYEGQMTRPMPIVLLMHIPLYLPKDGESDNVATCGDPRWGWDTDKHYEIERRERWPREGNLPSTVAFLEAVQKSTNLVAVLVGHTHKARVDRVSETAIQYVTGRSADGQHRLLTFTCSGAQGSQ